METGCEGARPLAPPLVHKASASATMTSNPAIGHQACRSRSGYVVMTYDARVPTAILTRQRRGVKNRPYPRAVPMFWCTRSVLDRASCSQSAVVGRLGVPISCRASPRGLGADGRLAVRPAVAAM